MEREEVPGGGLPAAAGGRRRPCVAAAPLRRGKSSWAWPVSTVGMRRSRSQAPLGAGGGQRVGLRGSRQPAAALFHGGVTPVAKGWCGRVWEVRWEAMVVLGCLIWGRRGRWGGAPWWPWAAAPWARRRARSRAAEGRGAQALALARGGEEKSELACEQIGTA